MTDLRFADDILFFALSRLQCTDMLRSLVDALRSVGLLLNAKKTKFLTTEAQPPDLIWLDIDTCIEVVRTCHKWLGCFLSMSGTHDADVDFHVSSASRAFWANKWLLCDVNVSQQRCASDTLRQL